MRRPLDLLDGDQPPARCRGCDTPGRVVPILYGFHDPDAEEQARQGRAVLGVFGRGPNGPRWECLVCGARQ